mmetsp:Transcript_1363/g.3962  ORF Transcript_1363/g.3962 Transcript_1363/m.3962 type:complete len:618 (-) Transcript_1363:75-1928(-)
MSKRVWKLQEFVAHSGSARCARLGEKSGQVLATGGEDRRVNIWKVGKPNAMMSLTGHNSTVECLVFDKQEEVLVVGCSGGSMQVWNLEYRKMAGTLTGHRTACTSVEFHPYGEFFASGSLDTNLKIWDLRRKSCIQTYKGHSGSITSIRFSPHGRWVATGGQDSQVKLWDLTAGKLMRDLDSHKGPITSVSFHPKEYLLATGSADKTMKLWSLENFKTVGTTDIGTSAVQAVKFYVEEQAVISASQDALRTYAIDGLSPPLDAIDVDWRGLQDTRLCFPEEKLIAVATEGPQLGIWVADLQKREPSSGKGAGGGGYARLHSRAGLPSQCKLPFQATAGAFDQASADCADGARATPKADHVVALGECSPPWGAPASMQPSTPSGGFGLQEQPVDHVASGLTGPPRRAVASSFQERAPSASGLHQPASDRVPTAGPQRAAAAEGAWEQISTLASQHPQMMGVLQRRLDQVHRLKDLWAAGNLSGLQGILAGPQDHAAFCDLARAIMQQHQEAALNLDACQVLLPVLQDLLHSKYEDFASTAAQLVEVLLLHFGELITETRVSSSNLPERQMDLPREDRLRKCNACYDQFKEIHRQLPERLGGSRSSGVRSSLRAFLQRS